MVFYGIISCETMIAILILRIDNIYDTDFEKEILYTHEPNTEGLSFGLIKNEHKLRNCFFILRELELKNRLSLQCSFLLDRATESVEISFA